MARLIEVQAEQALPSGLTVRTGDLLHFGATGGRVRSGAESVEVLGPFVPGVVGTHGEVVSPIGAPNTVLFLARSPGRASIEVVVGDPWSAPRPLALDLTVEP